MNDVCQAAGLLTICSMRWLAPRFPDGPAYWPTLGCCAPSQIAAMVGLGRVRTERRARPKTEAKKTSQPSVRPPLEPYTGSKEYIFTSYSHSNMAEVFSIIHQPHKSGLSATLRESLT